MSYFNYEFAGNHGSEVLGAVVREAEDKWKHDIDRYIFSEILCRGSTRDLEAFVAASSFPIAKMTADSILYGVDVYELDWNNFLWAVNKLPGGIHGKGKKGRGLQHVVADRDACDRNVCIFRKLPALGVDLTAVDDEGNTVLHLFSRNFQYHWDNCKEVVEIMISNGVDINARNSKGKTALQVASSHKFADMLARFEGIALETRKSGNSTLLCIKNFRNREAYDFCLREGGINAAVSNMEKKLLDQDWKVACEAKSSAPGIVAATPARRKL